MSPVAQVQQTTSIETPPAETIPIIAAKKEVVRKAVTEAPKPEQNLSQEAASSPETTEISKGPDEGSEEKKEAPVEKQAPNLGLSANDYKVGVFGGISDLELSMRICDFILAVSMKYTLLPSVETQFVCVRLDIRK